MVDAGEQVSLTLQREFSEEALNSLDAPATERAKTHERITKLFKSSGLQVSSWLPLTYCHILVNDCDKQSIFVLL